MADVIIKWPQCVLVFTESEFHELLKAREDLWVSALRRGKGYVRAEKSLDRKTKQK